MSSFSTQNTQTELDLELTRLATEYGRRGSRRIPGDRYSLFNEATLLHAQSLERHLLALLKRHGFTSLAEKRILDVGCGNGGHLRRFLDYGALPANLSGIDLMAQRIEQARHLHPALDWQVGSAHRLPYEDASFDLVMGFVMFSSILNEALRQQIADEMWRMRKPGGLIVLHDFVYSNPSNQAVQGISCRHIRRLFYRPRAKFDFRRITLAPPVSRRIATRAPWLAYMLEHLKLLNTHMLGVIKLDE